MAYALLSVYDKSGLVEFAHELINLDYQLLASGSTAKTLREHNLKVMEVADYTQSPEMLNGRVKTLHPAIHASILARPHDDDLKELLERGWNFIDVVAVNLYPFEKTIAQPNITSAEAIENIDIGGVALMRAAAKNFERVMLASEPSDYPEIIHALKQKNTFVEVRKQFAAKGFAKTSAYDQAIANYLHPKETHTLTLHKVQTLRYGENPHQTAALYNFNSNDGALGGSLLQGKELSYNNLLDIDAALRTVFAYEKPTVCLVKHLSPCGIASAATLDEAFLAALSCDPVSAFGSIIACNREVDEKLVDAFGNLFIECIAAPQFSASAREKLTNRKNCRLLQTDYKVNNAYEWRSIYGGMLQQQRDMGDTTQPSWKVVTKKEPTSTQYTALRFAWTACRHVKSNAIVFAQGESTVGIGGGQPNRIDCVRIAARHARARAKGAVMASDAFFPFADGILNAAKHGIAAIIQPGGSVRDAEVIAAADDAGLAMVFTGTRHFRH